MNKFKTKLIALSAPSGAGKTTLAKALLKRHPELQVSISATTREKRPKETDGVDYIFLTKDEFKTLVASGCFLEYEEVHGNLYGTLKNTVEDLMADNKVVVFDIDVNGALSIKKNYHEAMLIFINAPNLEELKSRLRRRKSESHEMIEKRLTRIPFEIEQSKKFDHIIVNENFNQTINDIEKLILI